VPLPHNQPNGSFVRNVLYATISILLGLLVPLGVAEVALRFLPVNEGLRALPVNEANPVFHFTPNRDLTWSHGWSFDIVNHVHVNNAGYVNDQRYETDDARPLLAVVGDSYVEAAMVPYADTIQGRLAAISAPDRRVYSLGASGAPLSQYLVWAREARVTWKAQALVVVVISNDFDESLAFYKTGPGFHYYVESADGSLKLTRFDYDPSPFRSVVQRSSLGKYLLVNLQAQGHVLELIRGSGTGDYAGNTSAAAGTERVSKSKSAIDAFLADLKTYAGWRTDQVVFVVDGARYPEEAARFAGSYFDQMRRYFMSQARQAGFEAIDMDPWFFARAKAGSTRFEFPGDGHWNTVGHGLAADAVAKSSVFTHWLRGGTTGTND
jgi:hypothetical protein